MASSYDDRDRSNDPTASADRSPHETLPEGFPVAEAADLAAPGLPPRQSNTPAPATADACALLDAEHAAVRGLFDDFAALAGSRTKPAMKQRLALASRICLDLAVHERLESEIFYPAILGAVSAAELLAEAAVEHATAAHLVSQIEQKTGVDTAFDALVKTLSAYVAQHVRKEQGEIFRLARGSHRLDLAALGQQLALRREAILQEETQRLAARTASRDKERALQRAAAVQQYRDRAKAKRSRRGEPLGHTLALRQPH